MASNVLEVLAQFKALEEDIKERGAYIRSLEAKLQAKNDRLTEVN